MDSSRHDADGERRQGLDPGPDAEAARDLTPILSTLEARLDHLDQTTTAFEQRLQAIEGRLKIGAPSPVAPPAPTASTSAPRNRPVPPPPVSLAPQPEPIPARRDTGSLLAAAHALLDGEPSSRQPRRRARVPDIDSRSSSLAPRPTASPPPRRRLSLKLDELERAVSGRGLAWVGGLTLLLGALFFLSLAISRGWIGPEARVIIGLVAGIVVTVLGERLMRGGDQVLGPVLVAVGIGIWNLALVAGTRLYDFIPLWAALLGTAAGALVATAIAIRANAQVIALYGVVTALAAPLLFDVPAARTPMAFLTIVLAGSTAIALARGWAWVPPVAFVLSEIQFYAWWLSADAAVWATVLTIASISLLHVIAATGIEVRASSGRPRLIAALLLLLNAVAYSTVGFGTLADERIRLGVYLLAGVAAHVAAARFVLRREGAEAAFSRVALAIAVTLLTIAVPVVFDGPLVAMVWAAEAFALVWLANRYRSADGFLAAAIVFGLAVWHLFSIEYGASRPGIATPQGQGIPFANEAGLTLLTLLAMLVAAGAIVREQWARVTIAVIGFGLLIAVLPYELSGLALLAGWSVLAVIALGSERFLAISPDDLPLDPNRALLAANGLKFAAAIAGALAIHRAVAYEMPVLTAVPMDARVPYVGQPVAAAAIIILAALAAMAVTKLSEVREIAGSVAILVAAHLAAFELDPAPAVAVWAMLAVGAWALQRRSRSTIRVYLATSVVLLTTGVAVTLGYIAPPTRLFVSGGAQIDHPFLWSEATLALGALSAALFVIARGMQGTPAGGWLALGSSVLALYLVSIGIVDEFQRRVGGEVSVAELHRQSQVALSVVWAVLGVVAVALGLVRSVAPLRWFGLGLLALATGKVFLYDLASLDAVYRVMSFIVLGILLLLSAYAYRRLGAGPAQEVTLLGDVSSASAPDEPRYEAGDA
jgi:uncharacterized membrane protein